MARLCLAIAALALIVVPGAARADNPVLTGDVGAGDAFVITLTGPGGTAVTHLDPGTYTLVVHDHSNLHDFHLFGPGVNVATDVTGTGDTTFTVMLTDGTYTYVCDPHATRMKGSFTVGTPPPPPPPPVTTPPSAAAKLAARVGPGAKIGVGGTAGLTAGKATITVADRSKTDNFHLAGPGVNRATGVAFRGTATWAVTLQAGRYTFRSDAHKTLHGAFTVAARATAAHATVTVGSAHNSSLGATILVSQAGMTLYEEKGSCTGTCVTTWPPLLLPKGAKPLAGSGVSQSKLGTVRRPDGRLQVTYAGLPLYRYSGDRKPGDTKGQAFGKQWYAVDTAGKPVTKSPGGGGYGYGGR